MALGIIYTEDGVTQRISWHYSEPLPEGVQRSRVVTFIADGDELDLLLGAVNATIKPVVTIDMRDIPMLPKGEPEENR